MCPWLHFTVSKDKKLFYLFPLHDKFSWAKPIKMPIISPCTCAWACKCGFLCSFVSPAQLMPTRNYCHISNIYSFICIYPKSHSNILFAEINPYIALFSLFLQPTRENFGETLSPRHKMRAKNEHIYWNYDMYSILNAKEREDVRAGFFLFIYSYLFCFWQTRTIRHGNTQQKFIYF